MQGKIDLSSTAELSSYRLAVRDVLLDRLEFEVAEA
jgi:hypothetical protein